MYIIRAIPGACGDIVSAVIDNKGGSLTHKGSISFINQRRLLKNNHVDLNNLPTLLENAASNFKSISCQHYVESVMTDNRYKTITINVNSEDLLQWCITRLGIIYPNVNFYKENLKREMEFHNRFSNYTIELSDIIQGKLLEQLKKYEIPYMDSELYYRWLAINTANYPHNF